MSSEIRLTENRDLFSYFIVELRKEALRLMRTEFSNVFSKVNFTIGFELVDTGDLIYKNCIENIRGVPFTKEQIRVNIKKFENDFSNSNLFVMHEGYYDATDRFRLTELKLLFYKSGLMQGIIHYLHSFESYLGFMKYNIRHEIGHMIELISCDGMRREEMEIRNQTIQKATSDHYRKWNDIKHQDIGYQRVYEYYKLPQEYLANKLAGVDLDKLIKWNEILVNDLERGVVLYLDGEPLSSVIEREQRPIREIKRYDGYAPRNPVYGEFCKAYK